MQLSKKFNVNFLFIKQVFIKILPLGSTSRLEIGKKKFLKISVLDLANPPNPIH
jgi:hypothetical protein